MGIEYELKYQATPAQQERIFAAVEGHWQRINMQTTYYDTPAGDLSTRHFTLRRRLENGKSICTVKAPAQGGRGEWEVEAASITEALPELCKLGGPAELDLLTRGGVIPICGAEFTRRACYIETALGAVELALDAGFLFAGQQQIPLCEVEVELKAGTPACAELYARELAREYGLQPQPKSKFRRALELREGGTYGTTEGTV